jgi:hypothetical protein
MINSEVLEQSCAELQSQVERHRRLLQAIVEGKPELAESDCLWADCRHRRKLYSVLLETIAVMDETRKAFKSRQLETLRKDLARILQDEMTNR